MSSDEDPSFPFICEGGSGVLGIFGESSGGLPDMSSGSGVADLEDVFAKAAASIPVQTTPTHSSDTGKETAEKNSASDVLSGFQVQNTVLMSTEKSNETIPEAGTSALVDSVGLSDEIKEVLGDANSTLGEESTVLVSGDTSKNLDETTTSAEAGSVELAEEIMEVFANSKTVLDSENAVSKLSSCQEVLINDSCNLQAELDSLEQLAMERVREIEGELVNSSKQITDSALVLDSPKELKSDEVCEEIQKVEIVDSVSPLDISSGDSGGIHCKDQEKRDCSASESISSTISHKGNGPDLIGKEESTVIEEKDQKLRSDLTDFEQSKPLGQIKSQNDVTSHLLQDSKKMKSEEVNSEVKRNHPDEISEIKSNHADEISEIKSGHAEEISEIKNEHANKISEIKSRHADEITEMKSKHADEISELKSSTEKQEESGNEIIDHNEINNGVLTAETREENTNVLVNECKDSESANDIEEVSEITQETQQGCNNDNIVCDKTPVHTSEVPNLEGHKITQSSTAIENKSNKENVEDLHSYDTEDDDLKVLEAFIVKSATNPDICATLTEKDNASLKYSLESSLIDDLTKTDNDTSVTEVQTRNLSDEGLSKGNSSSMNPASELTPQARLSQALENASQKVTVNNDVEKNTMARRSITGRRRTKQKIPLTSSTELPLKKQISQKPSVVETDNGSRDEHASAGTIDKNPEKKTVVEIVVKRRGRPPGSGKKRLLEKQSAIAKSKTNDSVSPGVSALEKINNIDNVAKPAQNTPSARSSKSMKSTEKLSTSADSVAINPEVTENTVLAHKSTISQKRRRKTENECSSSKSLIREKRRSQEDLSDVALHYGKREKENTGFRKEKVEGEERSVSSPKPMSSNEKKSVYTNLQTPASSRTTDAREKRKVIDEPQVGTPAKKIDNENDKRNMKNTLSPHATRSTKRRANMPLPKFKQSQKDISKENVANANSSLDGAVTLLDEATNSLDNATPVKSTANNISNIDKLKIYLSNSANSGKRKVDEKYLKPISRRMKVQCESGENVSNVTDKQTVDHGVSKNVLENKEGAPHLYSEIASLEFENITFDKLREFAKQLVLPTPLWGAQVNSAKNLVVFSRLSSQLSDDKPLIDKALVFQGTLKPVALIMNKPVDLPIPSIRTFEDLIVLIRNFHGVSFCEGTGVKQRPQSKYCFRYLDVANPGSRCSQCLEERRRVLFGFARKLRERLRVLRAGRTL